MSPRDQRAWCDVAGGAQAVLRPWLCLVRCGSSAPALVFLVLVCGGKGCEGPRVLPVCGGTLRVGDREGRQVLLGCAPWGEARAGAVFCLLVGG